MSIDKIFKKFIKSNEIKKIPTVVEIDNKTPSETEDKMLEIYNEVMHKFESGVINKKKLESFFEFVRQSAGLTESRIIRMPSGLTESRIICMPSRSPRSLAYEKKMIAKREELFKKYPMLNPTPPKK